jgi:MarR family transcriptional regulator, organic hydroperoxide resistance regulator
MSAAMAAADLDPVLQFMRLMWSVDHGLHKVSKRMAADIGLTGPQRLAIRIIGRSPGMAAGELASLMHLDPSTVTGIIRRLEQARVISRRPDPADARRARLTLTTRGRELDRRSAGTIEAAVRRALASLPQQQVAAASQVLAALAAQLLDGHTQERPRGRTRSPR